MIALFLAACTPEGGAGRMAVSTSVPTESSDPSPTNQEIPGLADAVGTCADTFAEPAEYPNQLQRGEDLHRIVLRDEFAVCGDGSQASLYVRAATDPDHLDDWVFHLQGGGDCVSFEECEVRWCGSAYYDASKMSTAWNPEAILGVGVHNPNGEKNDVAGWNHGYFYYCSSDLWSGQSAAILTSEDGTRQMRVERRGHQILEAGFEVLDGGATSDDGSQSLPPLADAEGVWLTGTSAGSMGAQAHLDWLAERLPGASVWGVFDAAIRPDPSTVDPQVQAGVDAVLVARYGDRLAQEARVPFQAADCVAAVPLADRWQCAASAYLPYRWVETPFFAKMDLFDSSAIDDYQAVGASKEDFGESVFASLSLLAADGQGVFGPSCGQHVALEENWWFLDAAIRADAGPQTLHDAISVSARETPVVLLDPGRDLSKCQ